MSDSDGGQLILPAIGVLFGIGAYHFALGQYRLRKIIEYTPTSKSVSVAPGIAELSGKARQFHELVISPYNNAECVYYRTDIYKWSGSGKHRKRSHVWGEQSEKPFYIEDETGVVAVIPPSRHHASSIGSLLAPPTQRDLLKMDTKKSATPGSNGVGALLNLVFGKKSEDEKPQQSTAPSDSQSMCAFLQARYPSLANYSDRVDVEETFIRPGDSLFVVGSAKLQQTGAGHEEMAVSYGDERKIFLIADGDERGALSRLGWEILAFGLCGPILFGASAFFLVAMNLPLISDVINPIIAAAVLLMYLIFLLIHLLELYNGTVQLRSNIERARANVNALYQMRHDLIPSLVEVVRGSAQYEAQLQGAVAEIRKYERGQSANWVAVFEAYPNLQANQNFLQFQHQIEYVQEKIAGSQSYLLDATMLYNKRIQSLPYSLFMPAMGFKALEYKQE